MPRRSPRFMCPLLNMGYDEIAAGLMPCLSISEAFVFMQTCRSIFISVLRVMTEECVYQLIDLHDALGQIDTWNLHFQNGTIAMYKLIENMKETLQFVVAYYNVHPTRSYVWKSIIFGYLRNYRRLIVYIDETMHLPYFVMILSRQSSVR